jgi:hypothetical protein
VCVERALCQLAKRRDVQKMGWYIQAD